MQFDHYFADFAKSKAKEPIIENGRWNYSQVRVAGNTAWKQPSANAYYPISALLAQQSNSLKCIDPSYEL
jgi:hypothetical protein